MPPWRRASIPGRAPSSVLVLVPVCRLGGCKQLRPAALGRLGHVLGRCTHGRQGYKLPRLTGDVCFWRQGLWLSAGAALRRGAAGWAYR